MRARVDIEKIYYLDLSETNGVVRVASHSQPCRSVQYSNAMPVYRSGPETDNAAAACIPYQFNCQLAREVLDQKPAPSKCEAVLFLISYLNLHVTTSSCLNVPKKYEFT